MLKNAPTLAIVAVHTAENEPLKVLGVIQFNIFQYSILSLELAHGAPEGREVQRVERRAVFRVELDQPRASLSARKHFVEHLRLERC